MNFLKKLIKNKFFIVIFFFLIIFSIFWYWPRQPHQLKYGVTFSDKYAKELKLDSRKTLEKIFTDLNVKKIRLIAYWDEIQKSESELDFSELDWQIEMAKKYNAEVVLVVGKRVPRWPECHIPDWALNLKKDKQDEYLLKFVKQIIERYKDQDVVKIWQVENEPFFTSYAKQYCGDFDKKLLQKEIDLVKDIDPKTPILLTDSGELGLWAGAYKRADYFGSTFYVYVANRFFEDVRSFLSANFYRYKLFFVNLFYGEKPSYLIEVAIEPWLTKPIIQTPFWEQLQKMNLERAKIIIDISSKTGFTEQYLWGAEWWYYLKLNGYPGIWNYVKDLNK